MDYFNYTSNNLISFASKLPMFAQPLNVTHIGLASIRRHHFTINLTLDQITSLRNQLNLPKEAEINLELCHNGASRPARI